MSSRPVRAGNAYVEISTKSNVQKGLDLVDRQLKGLGKRVTQVGKSMAAMGATAFAAVGLLSAPLGLAIRDASNMQEEMNKFNVVFGESATMMKQWADVTGKSLGRSKVQMVSFASSIQDLLVPMGFASDDAMQMSKDISTLAIDVASFNNKSDADVLRDFQAALTGSGEVMKKYGVIVSEAAVKQQLIQDGMDPRSATEAQKAMARWTIILAGTTAAQGDALRSAGSFANQMKAVRAEVTNLSGEIGSSLIDAVTSLLAPLRQAMQATQEWVQNNTGVVKALVQGALVLGAFAAGVSLAGMAIVAIGAVITGAATILATLSAAIVTVGTVIGGLTAAVAFIASPLGIFAASMAAIAVAIGYLATESWRASGEMTAAWNSIGEALQEVWALAKEAFGGILDALEMGDWGAAADIAVAGLKAAFLTVFAEIELAFFTFLGRTVGAALRAMNKLADVVLTGGVALFRDGVSMESGIGGIEESILGEAGRQAEMRRGQAMDATTSMEDLAAGATSRRSVRDQARTEAADIEAGNQASALAASGEQKRAREQQIAIDAARQQQREQMTVAMAMQRAGESFASATAEAERYRKADPREKIAIDQQRATAAAALEMRKATQELAQAQIAQQRAEKAGDSEEAKKQRDLAKRAAESMDSAARSAAEANSAAVEQMATENKRIADEIKASIDISRQVIGGFGGEGLENLPQMFAGTTGEAEKQTQLQRLLLQAMRATERAIRERGPLEFT